MTNKLMIDLPPPAKATALERAGIAWGDDLPDWVVALATACDQATQTAISRRLGVSVAMVSTTLSHTYGGSYDTIRDKVRGIFMASVVSCPVVGELAVDQCHMNRKAPWSPHNPQKIMFAKTCNTCAHNPDRSEKNEQ